MKNLVSYAISTGIALFVTACSQPTASEYIYKASPVELQISGTEGLRMGKGASALELDGHFVWGGSATRAV